MYTITSLLFSTKKKITSLLAFGNIQFLILDAFRHLGCIKLTMEEDSKNLKSKMNYQYFSLDKDYFFLNMDIPLINDINWKIISEEVRNLRLVRAS